MNRPKVNVFSTPQIPCLVYIILATIIRKAGFVYPTQNSEQQRKPHICYVVHGVIKEPATRGDAIPPIATIPYWAWGRAGIHAASRSI